MTRHFFIAGAQRSATTYLVRMLDQHPDITMAKPIRPEPKYFLREPHHWNREGYCREFFPAAATRWLGEKSTSYIEYPQVAHRIAAALPDARIIFMLRDPVERAISNHRFSVANGLEQLPLEQAIDREAERAASASRDTSVSPFAYTRRGHYVHYLDAWARCFPPNQMHLLTTEKAVGSEEAIRRLFLTLGLEGNAPLKHILQSVNQSHDDSQTVSRELRRRLARMFAESNHLLSTRYGVDTEGWQ